MDTAGWMCMADAKDPKHEEAKRTRDSWLRERGVLISSDYVIDETLGPVS